MSPQLHIALAAPRLLGPPLIACLEAGLLGQDDLARARAAAIATDQRIDQAIVDLGLMTHANLNLLVREQFGVRDLLPAEEPKEPLLGDVLKPTYLASALLVPVSYEEGALIVAMVDPLDDFAANAVSLKVGVALRRLRITRSRLESLLERIYGFVEIASDNSESDGQPEAAGADVDLLKDAASDAPVVRFVQDAINAAVESGASDIHLRASRGRPEMLFRIHGNLTAMPPPDGRSYTSVISRLKILANLDIAERRLPQDGRIRVNVAGQPIDIRISTMPHVHGEGAVLRLLSRDFAVSGIAELGFTADIEAGLSKLFAATDGLILVTGPTGSGKSTTLHAALKQLVRPELNVVTIEDPVEYRVDGAAQIQVDEKIGLTFPRVLRSLLRQDPDIILIGEIRDGETAKIAVQAALTGHLVLATLHTNSATAAVPRLIDMGVEPYLLAAVLRGVLAQRLLQVEGGGRRVVVGELLPLDAEVTQWLAASAQLTPAQFEQLQRSGYKPLLEDAEARVRAGDVPSDQMLNLSLPDVA